MKPKEDCFAYYEETIFFIDEEYKSSVKGCKALNVFVCKKRNDCPFYKKKGTENEVIFNAPRTKDY